MREVEIDRRELVVILWVFSWRIWIFEGVVRWGLGVFVLFKWRRGVRIGRYGFWSLEEMFI